MTDTVLALLLIGLALYFIYVEFSHCKECFNDYLSVASKCFDCEKQYPVDEKWKGQPAKCFDCEKELASKYGNNAVYRGKQSKCLDCMRNQRPLYVEK